MWHRTDCSKLHSAAVHSQVEKNVYRLCEHRREYLPLAPPSKQSCTCSRHLALAPGHQQKEQQQQATGTSSHQPKACPAARPTHFIELERFAEPQAFFGVS